MKVALVSIIGDENLYLRDFIQYYQSIGIDDIYIGDNSQSDNNPYLVIGDYIDSGYVKYINFRKNNEANRQIIFYNNVIDKIKNYYDWICVFDVDEYLTFNNKNIHNIKEFLDNDLFKNFGQIKINWRVYGDNDKLYYENKPVLERFPKPAEPVDFLNVVCDYPYIENTTTKLIVNCQMDNIIFQTPHVAYTIKDNKFINAISPSGNIINFQQGVAPLDYNVVQLNHYQTLTITEFLYRRLSGIYIDAISGEIPKIEKMLRMFFSCNKITKEKENIINNFIKNKQKPNMDYAAVSYHMFKDDIKKWIYKNFDENIKILDVGSGCGTYYNLLHEKYKNIDSVEIYEPNIINYNLKEKYSNVYNKNIIDFEYEYYDLIIFGDIIEHLTIEDAQKVLNYAYNRCNNFIVAVPYCYKQNGNENKWEEHIQDDLTKENIIERYPYLKLIYGDEKYGYYIKKSN